MSTGVALPILMDKINIAVRSGAAYSVRKNKVIKAEKYVSNRRLATSRNVAIKLTW